MSRCFPYRPSINKKEDLSLIGSIEKLQNGRGNNTKQRKELSVCSTEKLSKKRSRDEPDKLNSLERKNKRRRDVEKKSNFTESCHDTRKYDAEHLERSDLSEEQNPPYFVLNQCSSLQNTTESSQKNGVQDPHSNGKSRPGMVLRLKLPSKKPKDQELVSTSTGPCSTSQASNSSKVQAVLLAEPAHRTNVTTLVKRPSSTISGPCSTSQLSNASRIPITESTLRPKETYLEKPLPPFSVIDEPCFSGRGAEVPFLQNSIVEADPSKSRHKRGSHRHHMPKLERRFRELISWKPPSLQLNEPEEEDLGWLAASRRQPEDVKASAPTSTVTISEPSIGAIRTDSLQPRACYLPEYGMYQLPYVIPF